MEADSISSALSAELRGSCSEDFGSSNCVQVLAKASKSRSSPENLEADEQTNWQASQIRSLSHQLIHSTKLIKSRVAYRILNSRKSSEHDDEG